MRRQWPWAWCSGLLDNVVLPIWLLPVLAFTIRVCNWLILPIWSQPSSLSHQFSLISAPTDFPMPWQTPRLTQYPIPLRIESGSGKLTLGASSSLTTLHRQRNEGVFGSGKGGEDLSSSSPEGSWGLQPSSLPPSLPASCIYPHGPEREGTHPSTVLLPSLPLWPLPIILLQGQEEVGFFFPFPTFSHISIRCMALLSWREGYLLCFGILQV